MVALMTLLAAVVVVLVPGFAAVRWTCGPRAMASSPEDLARRIAVAYAGVGVACISLWLAAVAFGLSGWTSVGAPLAGAAVLLIGGAFRRGQADATAAGGGDSSPVPPRPGGRRTIRVLVALSLASVCLVAIPFAPYGWERADGVHRMAMTDWEKHVVMTTAVAASPAFPPPHPYLHSDPNPSYYFGYHLVAAAIAQAGRPSADVFAALWLLALLTAAATPFVVFAFARDLCSNDQSVVAAGASALLIGFDAIVLAIEAARAAVAAWPIPGGLAGLRAVIPSTHIDWWLHNIDRSFSAPVVTTMWAPHQTAATLIALVVLHLLAPRPEDPSRPRSGWLLPSLLIASLPGLSSYLALALGVGVGAAAITASVTLRRAPWRTDVFHRWAVPGTVGVLLALPLVPTLVHGSSSGLVLYISTAGTWSNGAVFTWLFGSNQLTSALDTPAVFLVDLGIIGLIGVPQIVRLYREGQLTPVRQQAAAVAVGVLLLVTFVRPPVGIGNNLYARAVLLSWFALAPFAAIAAFRVWRTRWFRGAVLVSMLGTCYVEAGYLLEGTLFWATPKASVEALRWVNAHTPPASLVAIRPSDYENNYGYWLGRPIVLGGKRLALLFGADPEHYDRTAASLERAFDAEDANVARAAFDPHQPDVILVRREAQDPVWAAGPCFGIVHRNQDWIVVLRTEQLCARAPRTGP